MTNITALALKNLIINAPEEISKGLDRFTLRMMTKNNVHHPVSKLSDSPASGDTIAEYIKGGNTLPVRFNFEETE